MLKSRRLMYLCKNMIISFYITFLQNLSRVMRHTKSKEFKEKRKSCQNHEGSCISGYIFRNPKKLLLSSITKKYQLWALLESGIGWLNDSWWFWTILKIHGIIVNFWKSAISLFFLHFYYVLGEDVKMSFWENNSKTFEFPNFQLF